MKRYIGFCLIVLCFSAALALGLNAQGSNASISGRVVEASGAIIAGAKVTITNAGTALTRVATDSFAYSAAANGGLGRGAPTATAGQMSSTATPARKLQAAARVVF
jgi:hypothetical protein